MSKNDGPCKHPTCDRVGQRKLGYCTKHYAYFHINGIPEPVKRAPKKLRICATDVAWLAAVIDCEGWIGLRRRKSKVHNGWAYWGSVGVGNTNKLLIDKLVAITGVGKVAFRAKRPPAKDQYDWNLWSYDEVRDFLVTIRPRLILKGAQADIILAMAAKSAQDPTGRRLAWEACARLNKKGRH